MPQVSAISLLGGPVDRTDETLLPYVDELFAEYRTLSEKIANAGADEIIQAMMARRQQNPDQLSWPDANQLETALLSLLTVPRLLRKLADLRAEYKRLCEVRYLSYIATAPAIPTDPAVPIPPETIAQLRADAESILAEIHWLYLIVPVQEDSRNELLRAVVLRVFFPILLVCLTLYSIIISRQLNPAIHLPQFLGGVGLSPPSATAPASESMTIPATTTPAIKADAVSPVVVCLFLATVGMALVWLCFASIRLAWSVDRKHWLSATATFLGHLTAGLLLTSSLAYSLWTTIEIIERSATQKVSWAVPPILLVILFGALGGGVSMQRRLQSMPLDGNPFSELLGSFRSRFTIYLSPILGAIFALLLYCVFGGGLLSGTFFPTFTSSLDHMMPPADDGWLDFFWCARPSACADLGKLLVWAFIAGFAERFVPDTIDRLVNRSNEQSGSTAPQTNSPIPAPKPVAKS